MAGESIETVALIDPLGFIREEHGVAIEGDAQLTGMSARVLARFGIDARRRTVGLERAHDVGFVRREEEIGLQRVEVAVRRAPAREYAALDGEAGELRRAEDAQAGYRVVLGQDHYFHALRARRIECEQLLHQRERHALARRHVEPRVLQRDVGRLAVALEDPVLLLEVEQRPRRDRDDQLPFD